MGICDEQEERKSHIGYITDIRLRQNTVVIHFEFDLIFSALRIGAFEDLSVDIDLGPLELSRTRCAVKDEPIFELLLRQGYISQQPLDVFLAFKEPPPPVIPSPDVRSQHTSQVFIVHGHDDLAKLEMAEFY